MKRDELAPLSRVVIRQTRARINFQGRPREIIVALRPATEQEPDRVTFCLDGLNTEISMPVIHAYYAAVQASGRQLIPRTLRTTMGAPAQPRYRKSSAEHADMYGLPAHTVRKLRREGAPLDDPDRMGEHIDRIRGMRRKEVAA